MAKRLTVEQVVALERLTGRQYTFAGTVRKRMRDRKQSQALGLPVDHLDWPELCRLWAMYPKQHPFNKLSKKKS